MNYVWTCDNRECSKFMQTVTMLGKNPTSDVHAQIPIPMYEALRRRAFEDRVSQAEVIRRALAGYLWEGESDMAEYIYEETTYSDGRGQEYQAVYMTWGQVETVLGHEHRGDPEDDEVLVRALLHAGAPEWTEEAEGFVDEHGWGLYGPEWEEKQDGAYELRVGEFYAEVYWDAQVPGDEGWAYRVTRDGLGVESAGADSEEEAKQEALRVMTG